MSADAGTNVKKVVKEKTAKSDAADAKARNDSYVLPIVGARVPSALVNAGFWGGLVGAAALGFIDPPLALFVGAGVVIARHQTRT